ncbi:MAG: hypothetical protein JWM91_674 [Rhodospirillales bacterium]|nr:hypothetical protein [Rhodospirillales bacterium]
MGLAHSALLCAQAGFKFNREEANVRRNAGQSA